MDVDIPVRSQAVFITAILLMICTAAVAGPVNTSETGSGDLSQDAPGEDAQEEPDVAQEPGVDLEGIDQGMLDDLAEQYNEEYAHQMPRIVTLLAGDERINIHLERDDGDEQVYGVALDGMEIAEASTGGVDNATIRFHTAVETMEEIASADAPRDRAAAAYDENEIRYEADGVLRNLKLRTAALAIGIVV